MSKSDDFFGFFNVLFDGIVRSVEHYGRVTCFDASLCSFVSTMIKVKSNGNGDTHGSDKIVNHINYHLVSAHVLCSTFGSLDNNRCIGLLNCLKDALSPLKVVGVESRNCIVAFFCFVNHFCSRN